MLINRIALKNFKCFREVEAKLGRLTLLTGENSSGKSSLMYGMLAPFQSEGFPFSLSPNGRFVNMGDFEAMVFNQQVDALIQIDLDFGEEILKSQTVWQIDSNTKISKLKLLELKTAFVSFVVTAGEEGYLLKQINHSNVSTPNSPLLEKFDNAPIRNIIEFTRKISTLPEKMIEEMVLDSVNTFGLDNRQEIRTGLFSVEQSMRNFLYVGRYMNYIGSFRLPPERTYYRKAKAQEQVGISGEGYIDQLVEWELKDKTKFDQLQEILVEIGLLQGIKSQHLSGGRFDIGVKVKPEGVWSSLTDVGFGISQLLPVIVADLQLSHDSLLLLSQPEMHLHPSVQASLGDYFVNQIRQTAKQYVVETHSEYLLNRIRLAIVQGELEPSEVMVYYFEGDVAGTVTHALEFTQDGQILNAPPGFFETYMIDTMEIALHA